MKLFNATNNSLMWEDLPQSIQLLITDHLNLRPQYAVYKIWKDAMFSEKEQRWTIYFTNMGSFCISSNDAEIINKHKMCVQVPGNQNYLWSLTCIE